MLLDQQRLQACCSNLPPWMASYASLHLDTISKIINHLLILMAFCNVILLFASFRTLILPGIGFCTLVSSFLLCLQTMAVYAIFNNSRIQASVLEPNEFMVGMSLGISVGGCIIAWILTSFYKRTSDKNCDLLEDSSIQGFLCGDAKRQLSDISFWSGLIFWWNFCLSLLIAVGRQELVQIGQNTQYDNLNNLTMDHNNAGGGGIPNYQQAGGTFAGGGDSTGGGGGQQPFVGDYSSVPEIRGGNTSAGGPTTATL